MIRVPTPKLMEVFSGEFRSTFGPTSFDAYPEFLLSIARVVVNCAESERQLESVLRMLVPGSSAALGVLLSSFRGHERLAKVIHDLLLEQDLKVLQKTFEAIEERIGTVFSIRNRLAHGIFEQHSGVPDAVIVWSLKQLTKYESDVTFALANFDFSDPESNLGKYNAEIWGGEEFAEAAVAASGLVNALYAFQGCISQSPREVTWLHEILRSQGLLSAPPWKLTRPTVPE